MQAERFGGGLGYKSRRISPSRFHPNPKAGKYNGGMIEAPSEADVTFSRTSGSHSEALSARPWHPRRWRLALEPRTQADLTTTITTTAPSSSSVQPNKLGQYHCWNREFDLHTGRWTTPDPASQLANELSYLGEYPIHSADPTGLSGGFLSDPTTPYPKVKFGRAEAKTGVKEDKPGPHIPIGTGEGLPGTPNHPTPSGAFGSNGDWIRFMSGGKQSFVSLSGGGRYEEIWEFRTKPHSTLIQIIRFDVWAYCDGFWFYKMEMEYAEYFKTNGQGRLGTLHDDHHYETRPPGDYDQFLQNNCPGCPHCNNIRVRSIGVAKIAHGSIANAIPTPEYLSGGGAEFDYLDAWVDENGVGKQSYMDEWWRCPGTPGWTYVHIANPKGGSGTGTVNAGARVYSKRDEGVTSWQRSAAGGYPPRQPDTSGSSGGYK